MSDKNHYVPVKNTPEAKCLYAAQEARSTALRGPRQKSEANAIDRDVGSLPWELASPLSAIRVRGPIVAHDEELSNTAG